MPLKVGSDSEVSNTFVGLSYAYKVKVGVQQSSYDPSWDSLLFGSTVLMPFVNEIHVRSTEGLEPRWVRNIIHVCCWGYLSLLGEP